jgi:hypothetical protein
LYQHSGLVGSLWGSAVLAAIAGANAFLLPRVAASATWSAVGAEE